MAPDIEITIPPGRASVEEELQIDKMIGDYEAAFIRAMQWFPLDSVTPCPAKRMPGIELVMRYYPVERVCATRQRAERVIAGGVGE